MFIQSRLHAEYLKDRYSDWARGKHKGGNLYNERTFYQYFTKDLLEAEKEVIIYSPFVAKFRTDYYKRTIEKLMYRNINVFIFTRPVEDYEPIFQDQIRIALERYEEMGVCVFFLSRFIHEKAAIIDRKILWEGSLNILSHKASREIMRRTSDEESAMQVIQFLGLSNRLAEGYKFRYEKFCEGLKINSEKNRKLVIMMFLLGFSVSGILWLVITYMKYIQLLSLLYRMLAQP
ncbi:MAG: hypothetical protein BWY68_00784 [bacterium ADurb.Bin400]|nr:MAG: hypothetical protein BWY68_00784 [bacterium ADurb.Bin400]